MMQGNNIIQKQILYLDIHEPVTSPFAIQETVAKWCSEVLVDAIGKRLEKYTEMEEVVCIDEIEIELSTWELLDGMLAERIASEIEAKIQARIGPEPKAKHDGAINSERTRASAFIFFLQNGYLPWWSSLKTIEDLIAFEQLSVEERHMLKALLKDKASATRFATALPLNIFIPMLSQFFQIGETQISLFFQKIEKLALEIQDKDLQHQFLFLIKQQFISAYAEKKNEVFVMKQAIELLTAKYQIPSGKLMHHIQSDKLLSEDFLLHRILADKINDLPTKDSTKRNDETSTIIIETEQTKKPAEQKLFLEKQQLKKKQEGIYIENAGLVLLAPFIPRFFGILGIVENNSFNSKDLALALLQWLVTGKELYAEFDLVLPKIICGMEPEDPVIIIAHLPQGFKKEGEILLQSVIEHWSILKNTSIEGLRESFLQREGKLSFQQNEWLLQVEQKPYDMLLEHLPWNISMTRLSWMPYLLRTEWIA